MSTEVPSPRKLSVEPATTEELRAKYNTDTNDTDTEEEQLAKYNEQLAQEEQANLTRAQQMRRLFLIGGATLGVGVTAMVGANLMGNATAEKGPDTQPEATNSADATPGGVNETTAPTATAEPSPYASPANTAPLETMKPIETASTLELEVGQSDTELATDFTESLREWNNAGVDTIIEYRRTSGTGKSAEEVAAKVALANQKKFIVALFGDDVASTPEIAKFITDMTTANENTLKYAILTDPSLSLANEENYMRSRKIVSPIENRSTTDTERTLVFTMETSSNYKKTSFRDKQTDQDDIATSTYTVSFNTEGNKEKVSRISFVTK